MITNRATQTIKSHLQLKSKEKKLKVVTLSVLQNTHKAHTMHRTNPGIF